MIHFVQFWRKITFRFWNVEYEICETTFENNFSSFSFPAWIVRNLKRFSKSYRILLLRYIVTRSWVYIFYNYELQSARDNTKLECTVTLGNRTHEYSPRRGFSTFAVNARTGVQQLQNNALLCICIKCNSWKHATSFSRQSFIFARKNLCGSFECVSIILKLRNTYQKYF